MFNLISLYNQGKTDLVLKSVNELVSKGRDKDDVISDDARISFSIFIMGVFSVALTSSLLLFADLSVVPFILFSVFCLYSALTVFSYANRIASLREIKFSNNSSEIRTESEEVQSKNNKMSYILLCVSLAGIAMCMLYIFDTSDRSEYFVKQGYQIIPIFLMYPIYFSYIFIKSKLNKDR
jgi:hypothetical protein